MPTHFYADLVRVVCHATGTGALALGDAVPGHRPFAGVVPPGTPFHYAIAGIANPAEWENGIGQLAADGRLERTAITASSAGGAAVEFGEGLKTAALTVGAGWFSAAESAQSQAEADIAALTAAVTERQPLSTLHPAASLVQAGDSLTLRRGAGWVNAPVSALFYRSSAGRFVADAPVELTEGSAAEPALQLGGGSDAGLFRPAAASIAISTSGSERLRVAANGNVGIGLSAPTQRLEIYGGAAGTATNLLVGNAATGLLMGVDPGDTCQIRTAQAVPILFYTGGTERLRIGSSGAITPGSDNGQSLGSAAMRWSQVYAASGTINTSDARDKQWRGPLSAAELRAASRIARAIGVYQWQDAVAEKGADGARLHVGVRAQTVWAIMADEGLVDRIDRRGRPGRTPYAFLCYDRWRGSDARRRHDRYGVRLDQLALFLSAAQEVRLAALEQHEVAA